MAATSKNSQKLDTAQEHNKGTGSTNLMLSTKVKYMGSVSTRGEKLKDMLHERENKGPHTCLLWTRPAHAETSRLG